MNTVRLSIASALVAALPVVVMAQGPFATVTWEPGEVFLANGQTKTIAHSKTPKPVRVCIANQRRNAELRITADDENVVVHPGDCADVEGRVVRASPAGLREGEVLVLRYQVSH